MEQSEKIESKNEASKSLPPRGEKPRRPRLRLPFDGRRQDAGVWAYDHRIGLCVTIIVYLVLSIAFVSSKIVTGSRARQNTIYVDLQTLSALEQERDRLEEQLRRENSKIDWNSIRNLSSNENALNENLADDKGTNTAALNASAEATEREMRANREAYERGMREANAIGAPRDDGDDGKRREDRKMKGRVTVEFSFKNPVRYSQHLVKPAYRCEGGGEVIVEAVIDQQGKVLSASVLSGGDECMRSTAVKAARASSFKSNPKAPARQRGTITYTFIPQ
ncbi:MAG: energy transducer TonB [Alistipes sp.]|nr:energy transducer TonB [Alistipes sp.]